MLVSVSTSPLARGRWRGCGDAGLVAGFPSQRHCGYGLPEVLLAFLNVPRLETSPGGGGGVKNKTGSAVVVFPATSMAVTVTLYQRPRRSALNGVVHALPTKSRVVMLSAASGTAEPRRRGSACVKMNRSPLPPFAGATSTTNAIWLSGSVV